MSTDFNKVKSGVIFTKAAQKQDLQSGDTIPEALGKLAKYMDVTDDALSNIQPILTFDSEPEYESLNPVTSGGLYDYIELQSPTYINTFSTESDLYSYSGNLTNNDYAFVGTGSGATYYMNVYQYKSEVIRDTIENIKTVPSGSNILKTLNEPTLPTGNIQYKLDCYVTAVNNQSYGTSPVITVIFSDNTTAQITVPNANKTHIVKTYSKTIKSIQFMNSGQASNGYTDFEDIQILTTSGWNKLSYRLYNPTWDANQLSAINSGITSTKVTNYDNHIANKSNPHEVTKSQIGLGNVGNFKAVSTEASQGLTSTEQSNARTNINAQESLSFNGTYNASTNKVATESTITNAINALDVSSQGGAGKYISEISETNGKLSATPTTMDTSLSNSSTNNNCPTSKTVYDDQQRQDAALAEVENKGAKNLFKITAVSEVKQGVRFTINSDGTVTVTRESAGTSNAFLTLGLFTGKSGVTYTLSGCPATGSDSTYYMYIGSTFRDYGSGVSREGGTERGIVIYVDKTYSPDNLVFKPMICTKAEWDVSHTYVPYAISNPALTSAAIKAVDEGAKNLLPITIQTQTVKTVVFTVNSDGTITANGTVTGGDAYLNLETLIGDKYTGNILSGGASNLKICISKGGSGQIAVYSESSEGVEIPDNATNTLFLYAANGTQLNNVTVKPMICTASDWAVSQKFVPYTPTNRELYEEKIGIEDVFGVQPQIPNNTDLNTLQTIGKYVCGGLAKAQTLLNCPVDGAFIMFVDAVGASTRLVQRIYGFDTSTGEILVYIRALTINGWGSWYKFEGTEVT